MVKEWSLPIRWDNSAVKDLEEIYSNISKESIPGAKYVINEILGLAQSLGIFPEKYPSEKMLEGLKGNYRSVPLWSFKIIYEVTDEAVVILKIFNSLRKPEELIRGFEE